MKQDEAARALDISLYKYRKYEIGEIEPSAEFLSKASVYYGVTPEYVAGVKSKSEEKRDAFMCEVNKRLDELATEVTYMKAQLFAYNTFGIGNMLDSTGKAIVDIYKHMEKLRKLENNEVDGDYHFNIESNAERLIEGLSGVLADIQKSVRNNADSKVICITNKIDAENETEKEIKIKEKVEKFDNDEDAVSKESMNSAEELKADNVETKESEVKDTSDESKDEQSGNFETADLASFMGLGF